MLQRNHPGESIRGRFDILFAPSSLLNHVRLPVEQPLFLALILTSSPAAQPR